jgi:hypothetical protein
MQTLFFVLVLGLTCAITGCSKKKESYEVRDMNAVRAELREQVDRGTLTREEAIVKLAEAQARLGSKQRMKDWKPSPEFEALGKELKDKVDEGHMTAEEAKAEWMKAAGIAKSKAGAQKSDASSGTEK